ncbi:glycoside hydrolase family 32 protein [Kouleothrix sp.]|uniref:glycoside hydrolase family 32 protein n=1 Tax=Kouleothrix sp. TaxID=2779161 RepID=UPI00391C1BD7
MHPTTVALPTAAPDPRHRPRYHFLPPANWLNDPNGLIHWNGEYHLFYQYNPAGPFHALIHWGHAVSADLVHWRHLPLALAPEPGGPDELGCWSGCAVDHDGVPTLVYSGNSAVGQRACVATSADGMQTWQKFAGNPVIAAPPPGLDLVEYRDHTIWQEDAVWYQLIGSGIRGAGGAALLYRSADLYAWEYVGPLCVGDARTTAPVWTGSMWECPDFFELGGQHVLAVSVWDAGQLYYPVAFVGDYARHAFTPARLGKLDYGSSFYAPQTFRDASGRRVMFGWMREQRDDAAQRAAGWSGAMSLPRILALGAAGVLEQRPAPELEQLRGRHIHAQAVGVAETNALLAGVSSDTIEIMLELAPGDAAEVGALMLRSPDGAEQTRLSYHCAERRLALDTTRASLSGSAHGGVDSGPLELAAGEPLRLRIFVDRSIVEVFANERACVSGRAYPTRESSAGLELFASGGSATVVALDAWELGAIW